MSSFRIPAFLRPRRSFYRLRSFHLSPEEAAAHVKEATPQVPMGDTTSHSLTRSRETVRPRRLSSLRPANLVIPLRGSTIVTLAIISSLFFIMSISFAFIGADVDEPFFKHTLDDVATNSPGIVLIGESVDVDVDEPSITIRWSILGCGDGFVLAGSEGVHGSNTCGLPSSPLYIFVDNADEPAATYDPSQIPFNRDTGHRRSIQNLVQFDSDHVLDVHEQRLYPFDSYLLASTLRAVSFDNQTVPIRKIATIDITSSFDIETVDMDSYSTFSDGKEQASRDIDMRVNRPNEARCFTLLLFGVSWILTHVTIGHVMLARRLSGMRPILKHLISTGAILVAIPQLRNSMPDAPGLDGALIDCIGFFPQMVITSISVIILLMFLAIREFDLIGQPELPSPPPPLPHNRVTSALSTRSRPPPSPTEKSGSMEIKQYEMYRLMKHLKGQYVFPPVQPSHRLQPSDHSKPAHRRVKTMSKIMEAGEVSHWSDGE
ncbi:hypothetical protein BDQ12DRAFT_467407 [Crucibulum laeve]|uniref:Uncharacterized protein n=1 Tax=Crucibulum laeve TaxID=68775 RepID=A0A5C3M630_9AGAR|nr:hypothetical protein BDQ12DRAFT_467407 [Crucibulum laeve]